jgi:hypothetical protein
MDGTLLLRLERCVVCQNQRPFALCRAAERARLLPLPAPLPETARVEPIKVDSQAFIHLDT